MTERRSKDEAAGDWTRRAAFKMGGMGLSILLLGLALAIGCGLYKWHLSEKADVLRAEGRPVAAQVSDFYAGSGRGSGADWVEVTYSWNGQEYRSRVKCGNFTGCVNSPGPKVTVFVDPEEPEEFLLEGGNVTGSLFFLNSWTLIPGGILFAVIGSILLTITVIARRQQVAEMAAHDGDVRPPKVRVEKGTWRRKRNKRKR